MFGWFRELLEIRYEFRERRLRLLQESVQDEKICNSCEVLKTALERANYEKDQLLRELLKSPETPKDPEVAPEPLPIKPRQIPWKHRQQMLEQEDRAKALTLKRHNENVDKATTDKLERKLGIN